MPLALILGFVAYMVIYEAVHKESPWSGITQAFGGSPQYLQGSETPPPGDGGGGSGGPPPPGGGNITKACANFEAAVNAQFPGMQSGGDYVCKCIKDTCIPSQHAWGNAVDYEPSDQAEFDDFVRWVAANKQRFNVQNFLIHEPGGLWTHTDFFPNFKGTPPCFANGRPDSCVGCG